MIKQADIRKRKQINEKRLAAYTAAAGVALLAAAPADAAVQYSGVVDIALNQSSASIDIDGNGTNDLNFWHSVNYSNRCVVGWWPWCDIEYRYSDYKGGFSNLNDVSFVGASGFASNLAQGATIDISDNWSSNNGTLFRKRIWRRYSYGYWDGRNRILNSSGSFRTNPGYIGIRFDSGDGTKYGWIHIASVTNPTSYKIDGWAYDDSGQAIAAGQTTVVPEPTSIALFAAGAATIMAKRRWKKK